MVLDQVEDKLVQEKRHQVFDWLSTIPYRKHHSNIIRSVLKGSGQWLLTSPDYRNWWKSSTSSILWLHGMPGCGKTRLTARVIKELLQERRLHNSSNPFAYFYCAQTIGESERSDPCEILRCLLLQLSLVGNDDTVIPAIIAEWNTRNKEAGKRPSDIEPLTISECVTFMLQIAEKSSPTIVIDALDECTPSTRHELLNALERMVQKSGNVVKIFASSREDSDIKRRMSSKLHVLIGATENRDDIRSFIDHAIDRAIEEKSLLEGDVNDKLAREIKDALLERANGM